MVNSVATKANNNAGQNNGPVKPNAAQKNESKANPEESRAKARSLLEHAGDTATKFTEGATKTAINTGSKVAKASTSKAVSALIHSTFQPIRLAMLNPMVAMSAKFLSGWLSEKLDVYIKQNNINIDISAKQMVNQLLFGDIDALSEDMTKVVGGFIEKSMSPAVREALSTGNPLAIAKATGGSLTSGVKNLHGEISAVNPKGNIFTNAFRLLGKKIPFVNKLSPKIQPWAAGAVTFLFGGALVRWTLKLVKWLVIFAAGGGVLKLGQKILMGGASGLVPGGQKGPKPGLGGLGSMLGGGKSSPAGGAGNLLSTGMNLMNMMGKAKR